MGQMHEDELSTGLEIAQRQIAEQFPAWSGLLLRAVVSTGTSNAMFRVGDDMAVRLPLRPGSDGSLRKEMRWLPVLAPNLPLVMPVPIAIGGRTPSTPAHGRSFPGAEARDVFRAELDALVRYDLDDAMRQRARGWTVSTAIMALPYDEDTNAFMVDQALREIAALIADA